MKGWHTNHFDDEPRAETASPLQITVGYPVTTDEWEQAKKSLYDPENPPQVPKVCVSVQTKNISNRTIVLLDFAPGKANITFLTDAFFAQTQPSYLGGVVFWRFGPVLLKPGASVTAVGNVSQQIAFRVSGTYELNYEVLERYGDYHGTANSTKESDLGAEYSRYSSGYSADVQGILSVKITPGQTGN